MASTSGTTAFNLDFNDIVEEAYERAGLEVRTGYEFRTARRSFNMLTIEWANRGINLWTIEQGQFVMNTGQGVYALPSTTIDLLDQVIRTQATTPNQIDINISRTLSQRTQPYQTSWPKVVPFRCGLTANPIKVICQTQL